MSDRTEYEQMESPVLSGLGTYARAQVVNLINTSAMAEMVELAGGRVVLPPGFADRASTPVNVIVTRFLDDGSYELTTRPLDPELNHPGAGTRWERMEGPRRSGESPVLYEVEDMDAVMATLKRIDLDGSEIAGSPRVAVKVDYLRRGVGGWRRWSPPAEVIETLGGGDV